MLPPRHSIQFAMCCAVALAFGCAKTDTQATDTAGAADVPEGPAALSAADVSGRWNMTAVPETGDTSATTFVLTATNDNMGWTFTFPNRPPVPVRVTIAGDSISTDVGPYESVRRRGVQVRTNSVLRLQGGNIVGSTVAHYTTNRADSVLRLRVTGTRAP